MTKIFEKYRLERAPNYYAATCVRRALVTLYQQQNHLLEFREKRCRSCLQKLSSMAEFPENWVTDSLRYFTA